MKIVGYLSEENESLYDFDTIRKMSRTSKSKLHRVLHKLPDIEFMKYKNQFLYTERTVFQVFEKLLFERLDKIETDENEL
jgi:hypothetical protein